MGFGAGNAVLWAKRLIPPLRRVFWSGSAGAREAAENFAKSIGGRTLEMTLLGRFFDKLGKNLPRSVTKPIWTGLSKRFARSAEGPVDVFHSRLGVRIESVWAKHEYIILRDQGNPISYHIAD